MNKKLLTCMMMLSIVFNALADEGMWLPMLVKRLNADDLQRAGCKLTPEEIYDVNHSSLKDNIIHLEFCTAELVSPNGLMLTNHHCAMGGIQANTTINNNYLDRGFWAKNYSEDLPIPNQTASVLNRMEDVTSQALLGVTDSMKYDERKKIIDKNISEIEKKASEGGTYRTFVRDMFAGNQYILFVMTQYKDVRLAGFPPQGIGKFGGDTDNWMWPRHTGDFALMRIYTGADGKPAPFSKSNVPLKSKNHLRLSIKGIKEGDFAMIMGFPGRTNRYATSEVLKMIYELENPLRIKIQGKILESWKSEMDKDMATRYKYAAKYASKSNGHKYAIGQNKGLAKLGIIDQRSKDEIKFQQWVEKSPENVKYRYVLGDYRLATIDYLPISKQINYLQNAGKSSEAVAFASNMFSLYQYVVKDSSAKSIDSLKKIVKKKSVDYFKNFSEKVDRKTFDALLNMYALDIEEDKLPDAVKEIVGKNSSMFSASINNKLNEYYASTSLTDTVKFYSFLDKLSKKSFEADKLFMYAYDLNQFYEKNLQPKKDAYDKVANNCKRLYLEGYLKMNAGKSLYPDANGTERLSYGKIATYQGKDGYKILWQTTTDGILEKYDTTSLEFNAPEKLIEMIKQKKFGKYAQDGVMPVAFLTTNDITGGNSGSPVLNDKGELIGLAFDGNWEAMTGDLVFDPNYKRTICVDIRYVLFIIEKFADAQNIMSEFILSY
jgi:hypothetical protein